jgi:hypothetical protein
MKERVMKWKSKSSLKVGEERILKIFLILPWCLRGYWKWLTNAYVLQRYVWDNFMGVYAWKNDYYVEGSEEYVSWVNDSYVGGSKKRVSWVNELYAKFLLASLGFYIMALGFYIMAFVVEDFWTDGVFRGVFIGCIFFILFLIRYYSYFMIYDI